MLDHRPLGGVQLGCGGNRSGRAHQSVGGLVHVANLISVDSDVGQRGAERAASRRGLVGMARHGCLDSIDGDQASGFRRSSLSTLLLVLEVLHLPLLHVLVVARGVRAGNTDIDVESSVHASWGEVGVQAIHRVVRRDACPLPGS